MSSVLPYVRLASVWIDAGLFMAAIKNPPPEPATEEERIQALLEMVDEINRACPVNNGKPAIMGEATEIGGLLS
jgi:hypothetical protein